MCLCVLPNDQTRTGGPILSQRQFNDDSISKLWVNRCIIIIIITSRLPMPSIKTPFRAWWLIDSSLDWRKPMETRADDRKYGIKETANSMSGQNSSQCQPTSFPLIRYFSPLQHFFHFGGNCKFWYKLWPCFMEWFIEIRHLFGARMCRSGISSTNLTKIHPNWIALTSNKYK